MYEVLRKVNDFQRSNYRGYKSLQVRVFPKDVDQAMQLIASDYTSMSFLQKVIVLEFLHSEV